ncbi:MAG: hypothetical protein L7F77_13505 [Candidatus Magnetominusculus sp. LBB02]|nr:hypothetical protein [Candidatus Magnetominusculus sp. LBB02]
MIRQSLRWPPYLLLALLPIVAAAIYISGQRYDPAAAMFSFQKGSADSIQLPGDVEGYKKIGSPRLFTKDNLYEYNDGHAEYFISKGFAGLNVYDYAKTGTQAEALVEIYDMGKPIQAFAVLTDEAPKDAQAAAVGAMGYSLSRGMMFFTGRYYVKIIPFNDAVPAGKIASAVEKAIGARAEPFTLFERFPKFGKVVATQFIKENYRGMDFVHDAVEREYDLDGAQVFIVLIPQPKTSLEAYLNFFKTTNTKYTVTNHGAREIYNIDDKYEGQWSLIPMEDTLMGVFFIGKAADDKIMELITTGR